MPTPSRPSHLPYLAILAAGLALLFFQLEIRLNLSSGSASRGIYVVSRRPPARGALVTLCLPEALGRLGRLRGYLSAGPCPGGGGPVGKRIAALPGDRVEVTAAGLRVNGQPLPNTARRSRDSAGRPIPSVPEGLYTVEPGTAWLVTGFHPRSWDSRYYGAVPLPEGTPTLLPLLLLDPPGEPPP